VFRLKRSKLKLPMGIVIDRKIHPGVTPIADAIKNNDSLMPGPLMGFWIKLTFHSPGLLSNGQVIWLFMDCNQVYQMKEVETLYFLEAVWSMAVWCSEM
jgi:hypothetical protein